MKCGDTSTTLVQVVTLDLKRRQKMVARKAAGRRNVDDIMLQRSSCYCQTGRPMTGQDVVYAWYKRGASYRRLKSALSGLQLESTLLHQRGVGAARPLPAMLPGWVALSVCPSSSMTLRVESGNFES
jgi:hypothetical protein